MKNLNKVIKNSTKTVLICANMLIAYSSVVDLYAWTKPTDSDRESARSYYQNLENKSADDDYYTPGRGWLSGEIPRRTFTAQEFWIPLDTRLRQIKYIDMNGDGNDDDSICTGINLRVRPTATKGGSDGGLYDYDQKLDNLKKYTGLKGCFNTMGMLLYGDFDGCYPRFFPLNTDTRLFSEYYGDWKSRMDYFHANYPTMKFLSQFTSVVSRDSYGYVDGYTPGQIPCGYSSYYNGVNSPAEVTNWFNVITSRYTWDSIGGTKLSWYSTTLNHEDMFFIYAYSMDMFVNTYHIAFYNDVVGVCWKDPEGSYGQGCGTLASDDGNKRILRWAHLQNFFQGMEGDARGAVEAGVISASSWHNGNTYDQPTIPYFELAFHEYCDVNTYHYLATEQVSPPGIIMNVRIGGWYEGETPMISAVPNVNASGEMWHRYMIPFRQEENTFIKYVQGAELVEHINGTSDPCIGVFKKKVFGGTHAELPEPPWLTYVVTAHGAADAKNVYGYNNANLYGHSIGFTLHSGWIEFDEFLNHCDGRGFLTYDGKSISLESGNLFTATANVPVNPLEIRYQSPTNTNLSQNQPWTGVTTDWAPLLLGNKGTVLRKIPQITVTPSDKLSIQFRTMTNKTCSWQCPARKTGQSTLKLRITRHNFSRQITII
jgi:hypothetical protein